MTDPTELTIAEAAKAMAAGELDAVQLTEAYLARIEERGGALNCFITLTAETAREQARAAAERAGAGKRLGPLDGIPIALTDNIDVAGVPTTNGFGAQAAILPEADAEVAEEAATEEADKAESEG